MGPQGDGGLHLSGIVIALLMLVAWVIYEEPLERSRPAPGDVATYRSDHPENISARLWQDPFDALARESRIQQPEIALLAQTGSGARRKQSNPDVVADYSKRLIEDAQSAIANADRNRQSWCAERPEFTLMPVFVSGAPYAEAKERRLRYRYSVLAALMSQGFHPVQSEHLGYVNWNGGSDGKSGPIRIAFEAFLATNGGGCQRIVLVLWLNEEKFRHAPLGRLAALIEAVKPDSDFVLRLRVIGPSSSDGLERMLAESCRADFTAKEKRENLAHGILYSPWATAPLGRLAPGCYSASTENKEEEIAKEFLNKTGLTIIRTIAPDEMLIEELVAELYLRGIRPASRGSYTDWPSKLFNLSKLWQEITDRENGGAGPSTQHIVLISERDTAFGRTLPQLFVQEVAPGEKSITPCRGALGNTPEWVHCFGYLRGLDGDLPSRQPQRDGDDRRRGDLASLAEGSVQRAGEPAVGANQYDYLRRLGDEIAQLDRRLRDEGKGQIRAFGVLGSDLYDKLLILQGLREHFPNHQYFTTDLDARYLDPRFYAWTRNLLVASSFGLSLHERWQREWPSFRNVYQTSSFLSGILALQDAHRRSSGAGAKAAGCPGSAKDCFELKLLPRVFEVGRHRFYGLQLPDGGAKTATTTGVKIPMRAEFDFDNDLYSSHYAFRIAPGYWVSGAIVLVLSAVFAWLMVPPVRRFICRLKEELKQHKGALSATLAALAVLAVAGAIVINQSLEPLVVWGGVSIWPSEILKALAGVAAGVFLYLGWDRVRATDCGLGREFELVDHEECQKEICAAQGDGEAIEESTKLGPSRAFGKWYDDQQQEATHQSLRKHLEMLFPAGQQKGQTENGARGTGSTSGAEEPNQPDPDCSAAVKKIWTEYRTHAGFRNRLKRVGLAFSIFYLLCLVVVFGFDDLLSPHRDWRAYWSSVVIGLGILGVPFLFLLLAIVDETLLTCGLVRRLSAKTLCWDNLLSRHQDPEKSLAREWLTIEFIARRTASTGDIVYYPFVIILIILFSLSTRFDNWDTPGSVLGILGLSILIAVSSAVLLRKTANAARQRVLDTLSDKAAGERQTEAKTESDRLDVLINRIREIHGGAFRRWYNDPVVRSLAWVFSVGAIVITEYFRVNI